MRRRCRWPSVVRTKECARIHDGRKPLTDSVTTTASRRDVLFHDPVDGGQSSSMAREKPRKRERGSVGPSLIPRPHHQPTSPVPSLRLHHMLHQKFVHKKEKWAGACVSVCVAECSAGCAVLYTVCTVQARQSSLYSSKNTDEQQTASPE